MLVNNFTVMPNTNSTVDTTDLLKIVLMQVGATRLFTLTSNPGPDLSFITSTCDGIYDNTFVTQAVPLDCSI